MTATADSTVSTSLPLLPPTPVRLRDALVAALGDSYRVHSRAIDRLKMAHDASHFLMSPAAVVTPTNAGEVGWVLAACTAAGVPLTFRSGGTSLSGQGVTDGVLADTRRHFRGIEVRDGGDRVRVEPGATVRQVNARLAPYGRKLGPDPASESACTLGGVVANNSSGMACGTAQNTYHTIESVVLVLPSGTVLDTGAADADDRLRALEPELYQGLERLRDRLRGNAESVRVLRRQFSMKNTMGYGLNSFLDYDRPADLLTHLIVGSEGTLAFVAAVTLRSVPLLPHAMTGLAVFEDLARATAALPDLVATGPATIELLDAASLRVGQLDPQADAVLQRIAVDRHAALLVEYQATSAEEVAELSAAAAPVLDQLPLTTPVELTADPRARAGLWHVRKGLYATIAGARPSGSTALLEDIVVPVPVLGETCEQLTGLFVRHDYRESVIFGHAKDGNIHFMLNEQLGGSATLDRFVRFTDDLVDLVLGHGGSLKAEHGTGRVMAPYVRRQYGDELYAVMVEVKQLCDPTGVLNPGVLLTDDPDTHLRHLKTTPTVEEEVDRCVECGYCEPVCPSKDLTTTPRQRIVLRRERERARLAGDAALVAELDSAYDYDAVDTCAVDGMCQTACPVAINTGDLVRRLRAEDARPVSRRVWRTAAQHWDATTRAAGAGLSIAGALPDRLVIGANRLGRRVVDPDTLPLWSPELPRGGRRRSDPGARPPAGDDGRAAADAVYFSACVGTMFGPTQFGATDNGPGVRAAFLALCERAGITLVAPPDLPSLCCGTPWKSKGMPGYAEMAAKVLPALRTASGSGAIPVVCDASSCTEGLRQQLDAANASANGQRVRILDSVEFAASVMLDRLAVTAPVASLALHPTCSSHRMGINDALLRIARAAAAEVVVPPDWGCCAFAGDRGLLHPELTASATRAEAAEVTTREFAAYASCNRTCELGMTRATGQPYVHILEVLERATRDPADAPEAVHPPRTRRSRR